MFKPDRPIESNKDDLLGRAGFSQSFGRAILAYQEKDSIVTALYGDWGSGKSSVINMALGCIDELTKDKSNDEKPIIVKFNPWNYSDQSHLIALFFKELSFALRRENYGAEATKIGEKLEAYSNFFIPLALIPDPSVSALSLFSQKVFKGVGSATKTWGAAYSKNLNATRKDLNNLLEQQKRKIIIVIDRGVVVKALAKIQEGSGYDYLEKIVQFPIELPPISKSELEKLFFTSLDGLIKKIPEEKWDSTYWGNIYHSGVKNYFKTIRDVTRYINTLKFSFEMVRESVNPVDFIAITTLQVFEPNLYSGIRDNKEIFTGVFSSQYNSSEAEMKQATARCDEIMERVQYLDKDQLTDFLSRLFPKLESLYENIGYGHEWMDTWRRESRICHPEIFDIYFMLALPAGEIPKNEIIAVLDLAGDKEVFSEALLRLIDDDKIVRYLELMEDYTKEYIKKENIENIVSVLMNIGDSFPEGNAGIFAFDTSIRVLRIFRQLSLRLDTQEKRFEIFKRAIEDAEDSLYMIINKVAFLGKEHREVTSKTEEQLKPMDQREINDKQLSELEKIAAKKISHWEKCGKLNSHSKLARILYLWERWDITNPNVSKEYVQTLISTNEGLINFVAAFTSQSISQGMGDYVSHKNWYINLKSLENFVTIEEIEPSIREIYSSNIFKGLNDIEKNAIEVFLNTFDGKTEDW